MAPKTGSVYITSTGLPPKDLERDRLEELAERASWIIFETTSQTPIILPFRDRITISPNRVTITKKGLLYRDEYPMPIENITGARVFTHFIFASIMIETFGIPKPEPIKNLKINDARLARRYILALIECKKANVNLLELGLDELKEKLKTIGMVQFTTEKEDYHNI